MEDDWNTWLKKILTDVTKNSQQFPQKHPHSKFSNYGRRNVSSFDPQYVPFTPFTQHTERTAFSYEQQREQQRARQEMERQQREKQQRARHPHAQQREHTYQYGYRYGYGYNTPSPPRSSSRRSPPRSSSSHSPPRSSSSHSPPGEDPRQRKRRIACEPILASQHIASKKDYRKFAMENHPDKTSSLPPHERAKRENLLKEVTACNEFVPNVL